MVTLLPLLTKSTNDFYYLQFFPASFVSSYLIFLILFTILVLEIILLKHPDCSSTLENWPNLQYKKQKGKKHNAVCCDLWTACNNLDERTYKLLQGSSIKWWFYINFLLLVQQIKN